MWPSPSVDGAAVGFGRQRYFGLSKGDRPSLWGQRESTGQEQTLGGAMGYWLLIWSHLWLDGPVEGYFWDSKSGMLGIIWYGCCVGFI